LKIYYDGFIYNDQKVGGINRYFQNIIERLDPDDEPVLLKPAEGDDRHYPSHPRLQVYCARKFKFRQGRIVNRLNQLYLNNFSRQLHPDLAHPTFFSLLCGQEMDQLKCPVVITVHDMISELYPALADPRGAEARMKKKALRSATAIICVSENTRNDMLSFYPELEGLTTVIHHGVDIRVVDCGKPTPLCPFFLYVGGRMPYKNFDLLLRSFAGAVSKRANLRLAVVGSPFTHEELKLIADLKLGQSLIHHGFVEDAFLATLYKDSIALVYPSLYEGFGIPLLEAMACGTTVIAANASSFPEVVGDAGLLFDPVSQDELTDMMLTVYEQPAYRENMIVKGKLRASQFTWGQAAEKTKKVYRSLLEG